MRKIGALSLLLLMSSSLFYFSRSRWSEKHLTPVALYCLKQDHKAFCQWKDFSHKRLSNREIKNISLTRSLFKGTWLSHIVIANSDFRQNNYRQAYFYKVSFIDTNMFKSSFYGARFEHVLFQNSQVRGSVFNFADFKNVQFKNMDLSAALFLGARFENSYYDQATKLPFSKEWARKIGLLIR